MDEYLTHLKITAIAFAIGLAALVAIAAPLILFAFLISAKFYWVAPLAFGLYIPLGAAMPIATRWVKKIKGLEGLLP